MARVQYGGGVTEFIGSIVGNTFQRNRSGPIVRNRRAVSHPTTPAMSLVQAQSATLLSLWRQLTQEQQDNWNTFADAHTRTNMFGQEKTLSGFNFYVSINSNLILTGGAIIDTPPTFELPIALQTLELVAIASSLSFNYTFSMEPTDAALIIYTTPPLQGTTQSFRQQLRLTKVHDPAETEDLDITSEWEATHHLTFPPSNPSSFNVAAAGYTVHTTSGLITPALFRQAKWTAA